MSRKWYYLKKEKAVGPVVWKKIIELYKTDIINENSKIWCNEFSDWVKLNDVLRQEKERSVTPPPLPSQKQKPPPMPEDNQSPPPIPNKQSSISETENKKINVGPIQSKEDYIASQTITKVSFAILSIVGTLTVIGLLSGGFQGNNDSTTTKTSQKWPSSFGFDNSSSFNPKPPSLSQSLVEDVYYAEGFKIGQNKSIDVLSNLYPELSRKLFLVQTEFNSEFDAAFDNINQIFSSKLSDWEQRKEAIRNSVSDKLSYTNISKSDAEQFLQKVKSRVNGELPSPVLETLLMFHPKYIRSPRLLFNDGYTKKYRSNKSTKAKGVDLAIQYPASWKAKEGRRPNAVQNFIRNNGYGKEVVVIIIKNYPEEIAEEISEENILSLLDENIWDNVSENTITIDEGSVTLANKPAIWGEFTGSVDRVGIKMDMHGLGFAMIDNKAMVQISFMIMQEEESNIDITSKFQHLAPTFQMMLNSLDFYDKYN